MSHGGTRGAAGGILVRFETADGLVKWRNVPDLEHRTLCSAGGLDPTITWYDVPRSFAGGPSSGKIEGMIHQGGRDAPPVGRITIAQESERFADEDYREIVKRLGWRAA